MSQVFEAEEYIRVHPCDKGNEDFDGQVYCCLFETESGVI